MARVRIDFQGRGEIETFSWARVQAMGDGVQLRLRVVRQGGALRQVLAQQPIGVFDYCPRDVQESATFNKNLSSAMLGN